MFFFFPFYGGGGFFFLFLIFILVRILRSLKYKNNSDEQNKSHYYYYNFGNNQNNYSSTQSNVAPLSQAYRTLGIAETATEAEIKKAYRKLIMEYHPDTKEGLSEESKKYATRKFREVQEAYEQICRAKGIK